MCNCSSSCSCSSSQSKGKCNPDDYTSELIYDGSKFGCPDLASVKPNCTPLNTVLELFASKICSILSRLTILESAIGFSFAFFQELALTFAWQTDETLVPDMTFTAPTSGNYQIHLISNNDINKGASGNINLYVDGVIVSTLRIAVDASLAPSIKEASIVWRGAVVASKVIEVKVQKLSADTIDTKKMSMLINKE